MLRRNAILVAAAVLLMFSGQARASESGKLENPCPATHPHLEKWSWTNLYWCYETKGNGGAMCRMSNSGVSPPKDGVWGTDRNDCELCKADTCKNGAKCVIDGIGLMCLCKKGFAGKDCSINIDDCRPDSCKNGGTCVDGVNGFTCTCKAGFSGKDCSINIDDCRSDSCKNDGICVDGVNGFTCTCKAGFSGKDCSTEPTTKDVCTGLRKAKCRRSSSCVWKKRKCENERERESDDSKDEHTVRCNKPSKFRFKEGFKGGKKGTHRTCLEKGCICANKKCKKCVKDPHVPFKCGHLTQESCNKEPKCFFAIAVKECYPQDYDDNYRLCGHYLGLEKRKSCIKDPMCYWDPDMYMCHRVHKKVSEVIFE